MTHWTSIFGKENHDSTQCGFATLLFGSDVRGWNQRAPVCRCARSAAAATQAVLMSVYRTLKLRGLNPTKTIAEALKTYMKTGQLPPLPDADIAHG
jgi:hypothetical protein